MFRYCLITVFVFMVWGYVSTTVVQAEYLQEDWFPTTPGTQYEFLTTDTWSDSDGESGMDGPFSLILQFNEVDIPIFTQTATLEVLGPGETPGVDGSYYRKSSEGLILVSYANPNLSDEFEYYNNGSLFLPAMMEVGQSYPYSTPWHGQWNDEGTLETWAGQADGLISVEDFEILDTSIGQLNTLRVSAAETATTQIDSGGNELITSQWTAWLAEGIGLVRYEEDWQYQYFEDEQLLYQANESELMVIVPEPGTAGLLVAAGVLILTRRNR